MADSTLWWLMAGGLVLAELLTGTFYLLMLALGAAAAALAAHLHVGLTVQMVTAAFVGGGAVVAWHLWGRRPQTTANDLKLDIGETVVVEHWNPDGTASVRYRGTHWTAIHRPGVTPSTGMHRVAEMAGNRLLLEPA